MQLNAAPTPFAWAVGTEFEPSPQMVTDDFDNVMMDDFGNVPLSDT
jgi:hypothetical protein